MDSGEHVDNNRHWPSEETVVLSLLNVTELVRLGGLLDLSPVSKVLELVSSIELGLEEGEVLGLDWVDSAQQVPVNVLGAWWSGHGSLVDPSVVHVNHLHKVAVGGHIDGWSQFGGVVFHLKRVEESIDDSHLIVGEHGGEVLNGEDDTHGSGDHGSSRLAWVVDGVHLEVVSDSINGMFRSSMEVELLCLEIKVSFEHGLSEL